MYDEVTLTKYIMTNEKSQLVKLEDLFTDRELASKQNELNILLNAEPKVGWVKEHPFVKNLNYIPIERIEWLLTMIFQKWKVEVKDVKQVANSVVVTVRLHVFNPVSGEWEYNDGIGASPLQVDKGAGAIDWNAIKSGSVQMAAPSAETYAVKDAAEKFGKIFGKDLNRKDLVSYEILKEKFSGLDSLREELDGVTTKEELKAFHAKYKGKGKEFDKLVEDKLKELNAPTK